MGELALGQGVYGFHGGAGSRHIAELEEAEDRLGIRLARHERAQEERAHLGSENHARAIVPCVERLDSEAIATEDEMRPGRRLEEGEGEHAAQALRDAVAPGAPAVEEDLAVAVRAERRRALEVGAELAMVVNLAVQDDPALAVLRAQGHPAAERSIDDGEPARSEDDTGDAARRGISGNVRWVVTLEQGPDLRVVQSRLGEEQPPVVGTAMELGIEHPQDRGHLVHCDGPRKFEDARDAAHGRAPYESVRYRSRRGNGIRAGPT